MLGSVRGMEPPTFWFEDDRSNMSLRHNEDKTPPTGDLMKHNVTLIKTQQI